MLPSIESVVMFKSDTDLGACSMVSRYIVTGKG